MIHTAKPQDGRELITRLRGGYRPTDDELVAWNVASTVDALRSEIKEGDLDWIMPNIELQEGVRAAFYLALVKPFAISSEVRSLLARRFDSASPSLRTELLWRLLDDPSLPLATHQRLFDFVKDHWDSFQGCLSYLGTPEEIVLSVLRRIAECPESKRWIYLCCLPQYAADPIAAKGILVLASASSDPFMAVVANSLVKRFWSDQMDNTSVSPS